MSVVRPSSSHSASRSISGSNENSSSASNLPNSNTATHTKLTRPSTAPLSPSHTNADPNASMPRCRQSRACKPEVVILNLPSIRDTPPGLARRALLLKKLRLCSYMFDSSAATMNRLACLPVREQEADAKMRETKRMTLLELINYFTLFKPVFNTEEYAAIFDMLAWNLFRPLPPSSFELHINGNPKGHWNSISGPTYTFSPEEDQQQEDPNWNHIQIAYEFLLRLVSNAPQASQAVAQPASKDNPHPEAAPTLQQLQTSHKLLYSTYLSRRFILSLLQNFNSEDIRERDYLKTILHRIYGNSMQLRPFIRRNLQHIFLKTIYEDERQHGISELLEILGSIINGFAVPLKASHIDTLLEKILIPLHKVTHLSVFHPQLSYCCMQFLEKDPKLADMLIVGLLKIWPLKNSKKEVLFLNEIEEILERIPPMTLEDPSIHLDVLNALVSKIASCIYSKHFQVSEKAIYMFNSDMLKRFVFFGTAARNDYRAQLVPLIARAIYINTEIPILNSLEGNEAPNQQHKPFSDSAMSARNSKVIHEAPAKKENEDPVQVDTPRGGRDGFGDFSPRTNGTGASKPAALESFKGHWNATITELTSDIIKIVSDFDIQLWEDSVSDFEREWDAAKSGAKNSSSVAGRRGKRHPLQLLSMGPKNLAQAQAAVAGNQPKVYTPTKAWEK